VGAALLLGLAQTAPGRDALGSLGLRSDARGYTELAFADPLRLPKELTPLRSGFPVSVPFIVRNQEGHDERYRWTVSGQGTPGHPVLLGTGVVAVRVGRRAYVNPRVPVPCQKRRVTVALERPRLSIAFWVRCR
jgi:hypothetical protein